MEGIGPRVPLGRSAEHGVFDLITSYKEEVKQNFKNLLLTSPGERVMDANFGVGVRKFLFEQRDDIVPSLRTRILEQVDAYMPFIVIKKISIDESESLVDRNILSVSIRYEVPDFNLESVLTISPDEVA